MQKLKLYIATALLFTGFMLCGNAQAEHNPKAHNTEPSFTEKNHPNKRPVMPLGNTYRKVPKKGE